MKGSLLCAIALVALAAPATAWANPPTLSSVGSQSLHATATFSAPRADLAEVAIATKPDRATDGSFLQENVVRSHLLTDSEAQSGQWLDASQVDPGTYYVVVWASADISCYDFFAGTTDPACADGYSNVLTLTVPAPPVRYTVGATRGGSIIDARIRATPLGTSVPYKLCYTTRANRTRCLTGRIDGFDWSRPADDSLTIFGDGLGRFTTLTWFVSGNVVGRLKLRVH